jgi:membrane-bound lytic murein transglycosylase D
VIDLTNDIVYQAVRNKPMQTESEYFRKAAYPLVLIISLVLSIVANKAAAHDIIFCGERIPVNNDFVANKLMNVIRKQIPNVNLPSLRQRALLYFPFVESFLKRSGLPADFKYLPIVESGFLVQTSGAGARGFWQLMPATAKDMGLVVSTTLDERDDINKSTMAACKVLSSYYTTIQKKHKVSSWILTAAAYNFGIGNIINAIQNQGKDYFTMNLNAETAVYVYKMIAVKELFEFPELYMKSFGYNVFGKGSPSSGAKGGGR